MSIFEILPTTIQIRFIHSLKIFFLYITSPDQTLFSLIIFKTTQKQSFYLFVKPPVLAKKGLRESIYDNSSVDVYFF